MNEWSLLLIVGLPILLIVGIYRLLARLTSRRGTRHGITVTEEERQQGRVFHDD